MSQLELLSKPALKLKPPEGRDQPRLWVRKLVIWENPETIIREIPLRPGLNIVWSPDPAEETGSEPRTAALGHGSGKTLFCRLLRYCLGEDRFAGDVLRNQVAYALHDGSVGAEVMIDGTCWSVIRPLGHARKHRVARDMDVLTLMKEGTSDLDVSDLIEHIENAILTRPVADAVAKGRTEAGWLRTLAWLTRDQECRFDHVLDWRAASAKSESPARSLSQSDLLLAMRLLIGAFDPAEYGVREEITYLEHQRDHEIQEQSHREWSARALRDQLILEMRVDRSSLAEGALGAQSLHQAGMKQLREASEHASNEDIVDEEAVAEELREARLRDRSARDDLGALDVHIAKLDGDLRMLGAEIPGVSASLDSAENPVCLVCEVPIDRVLADKCNLSHKLPDVPTLRARWERTRESIRDTELSLQAVRQERVALKERVDKQAAEVQSLQDAVDKARKATKRRDDRWFAARRRVDDARRLIELESASMSETVPILESQLEEKRKVLGVFRGDQAPVFRKVSDLFDGIIRRLVESATGQVTLDGHGLNLFVHFGGDRSTAAIDSLKVVAFDLAVLCMSVEGSTHLPAFLMHDSPREADLGLSHYHSLFDLVESLEPKTGEAPFQYIVTTTTRPPEHLARKPWLVETLRGTPAEERLLKRNL